jgi:hypothetical protein
MRWILRRASKGGGYVAPPGSPRSYVRDPRKAQSFDTKEEADASKCPENEVAVPRRQVAA